MRGGKLAAVAVPISEHNSTAALSPLSLRCLLLPSYVPSSLLVFAALVYNGRRNGQSNRTVVPSTLLSWARRTVVLLYTRGHGCVVQLPSSLPSGAASQVLVLSPSISFTIKIPPPSLPLYCAQVHIYAGKYVG